jgi:DNA-binding response OmpR family regulator
MDGMAQCMLHRNEQAVTVSGHKRRLTKTEFGLLMLLAREPGKPVTRDEFVRVVLGEDCPSSQRTIDVHIAALRRKLRPRHDFVKTVRGVGYCLRDDAEVA